MFFHGPSWDLRALCGPRCSQVFSGVLMCPYVFLGGLIWYFVVLCGI